MSFTPKIRTFLSLSEAIPESVKNAMVYELSIVIQCVVLQWLADHNDLVACSCIFCLSKTVTACSNVLSVSLLCFRALRLTNARQRSSKDLRQNKTGNVDKKPTRCHLCVISYFSFTSCSTCFGQPCSHLQELTTA